MQVLSGLALSDEVITVGSYGLDPGTPVKVGPPEATIAKRWRQLMASRAPEVQHAAGEAGEHKPFWLARSTRTIFFFAVMLTVAGIFLAFKVPV